MEASSSVNTAFSELTIPLGKSWAISAGWDQQGRNPLDLGECLRNSLVIFSDLR